MSVICFSSLKGGVGKTSLSMNIAHAFSLRGCRTLVIDLDSAAHATRLLLKRSTVENYDDKFCHLAKLFLGSFENDLSFIERIESSSEKLLIEVRKNIDLFASGEEIRHFLWGKGSREFSISFKKLLSELQSVYDYIIIDTPPDFNVLTRNAIAIADLVVVPVDSSEMSIHCLEKIISYTDHINGPVWAIARTLVTKSASKIQSLSNARLEQNLDLETSDIQTKDYESLDDPQNFISYISDTIDSNSTATSDKPIYLLNNVVYRTEKQNKLSFQAYTSFDTKGTLALATQYSNVAKEIEELITLAEEQEYLDNNAFVDYVPQMREAASQ